MSVAFKKRRKCFPIIISIFIPNFRNKKRNKDGDKNETDGSVRYKKDYANTFGINFCFFKIGKKLETKIGIKKELKRKEKREVER